MITTTHRLLFLVLTLLASGAVAASELPTTLQGLMRAPADQHEALLEQLALRGTPLVGNGEALFLARSLDGVPPTLLGDFNWFGRYPEAEGLRGGRMERIHGTEWWYARLELPPDARIVYSFRAPDGGEVTDPFNPKQMTVFGQLRSVLEMPEYEPSRWVRPPEEPLTGRLEPLAKEASWQPERRIEVYLPPGYPQAAPYPTVYFNDGGFAIEEGVPRMLDAMIREGALRPLVAVFSDPIDRREEYRGREGFLDFLAELVARVDQTYQTSRAPSERGIVGSSRGALAALLGAWSLDGLFELCGVIAPAIMPEPFLAELAAAEKEPIRFSVVGGRYDVRFVGDFHNLIDALLWKRYDVEHVLAPIGHSPPYRLDYLPKVLTDLFGKP